MCFLTEKSNAPRLTKPKFSGIFLCFVPRFPRQKPENAVNLLLIASALAGDLVSPDAFRGQAVRLTRRMIREDIELWYELKFVGRSAVVTRGSSGGLTVSAGCTPGGARWSDPDATDRTPRYGPARGCASGDAIASVPERIAQRFHRLSDKLTIDARAVVDQSPRLGWTVTFDDGTFLASAP